MAADHASPAGDTGLRKELADLLPVPSAGSVTITASDERSIAAHAIGTAITGDHAQITQPATGSEASE
ncbi:hypothetical protein KNE206_19350 [Kitasatospora sp. NE20-6]